MGVLAPSWGRYVPYKSDRDMLVGNVEEDAKKVSEAILVGVVQVYYYPKKNQYQNVTVNVAFIQVTLISRHIYFGVFRN